MTVRADEVEVVPLLCPGAFDISREGMGGEVNEWKSLSDSRLDKAVYNNNRDKITPDGRIQLRVQKLRHVIITSFRVPRCF
jgi:hypothetical protein